MQYVHNLLIFGFQCNVQVMSPEEREVIAYHECGHALGSKID